ncbi:flagellar filament capping protein FliD [Allosphingosinicella deserti]|uniref:Flagellar hook-associated protein 2 n=1 Tax=Allosphingosinicella deserti TaxID=2116704 RepID=A0A2P7QP00_9SPHN|nr:flagellar filament capping protein FliD [Sphingomonas deserti]PSJ39686.1 flagellar hook protein [Sphingomonas deserti]
MVSSISYSLGIGSGIDIKSLVDSLAEADRGPKEALIKRREEANAAKISALAEASSAIDSFAGALSGLISGGTLFTQPSVSDSSLVGATALPGARLTNLAADLEVVQLAKAQTIQSAQLAGEAAPVGQGDLTLVTAAGSFVVTIDASNDSLTGLAAAINGKNAGVTASVITDGTSARLVLKGATGAAQAFTLGVPAGTANGLDRFAFGGSATGGMTAAQAAQDAIVRLDGVEVRRPSNSIKDLVPDVQLDLKRALPGATVTLGITRPGAAIEQGVADFVSAFNELNTLLAKATAAGGEGSDTGALRGDVSIRELQRRLKELPSMRLASQGGIHTLAEIGVATNRDGSLSLNSVRLKAALITDPAGVEALFNPTQYSSSPLLSITTAMGRAKPGTYTFTNVVLGGTGVDATGLIDGVAATGSGNFLIAPGNSAAVGLAVEVKGGFASATVTIDPGLGGALQGIRDALRARSGPIATSQNRLTEEKADIADDRAKLETRSSAYYDKLLTQFTAMERRVSAFKATQTYLEQQIKAWNGGND